MLQSSFICPNLPCHLFTFLHVFILPLMDSNLSDLALHSFCLMVFALIYPSLLKLYVVYLSSCYTANLPSFLNVPFFHSLTLPCHILFFLFVSWFDAQTLFLSCEVYHLNIRAWSFCMSNLILVSFMYHPSGAVFRFSLIVNITR